MTTVMADAAEFRRGQLDTYAWGWPEVLESKIRVGHVRPEACAEAADNFVGQRHGDIELQLPAPAPDTTSPILEKRPFSTCRSLLSTFTTCLGEICPGIHWLSARTLSPETRDSSSLDCRTADAYQGMCEDDTSVRLAKHSEYNATFTPDSAPNGHTRESALDSTHAPESPGRLPLSAFVVEFSLIRPGSDPRQSDAADFLVCFQPRHSPFSFEETSVDLFLNHGVQVNARVRVVDGPLAPLSALQLQAAYHFQKTVIALAIRGSSADGILPGLESTNSESTESATSSPRDDESVFEETGPAYLLLPLYKDRHNKSPLENPADVANWSALVDWPAVYSAGGHPFPTPAPFLPGINNPQDGKSSCQESQPAPTPPISLRRQQASDTWQLTRGSLKQEAEADQSPPASSSLSPPLHPCVKLTTESLPPPANHPPPAGASEADPGGNNCPVDEFIFANGGRIPASQVADSIVISATEHRCLYVAGIRSDLTAKSPFVAKRSYESFEEYYKKRYGIDLRYPDQPLLQLRKIPKASCFLFYRATSPSQTPAPPSSTPHSSPTLPPELCHLAGSLRARILRGAARLPSVMQRVEHLLLAQELKRHVGEVEVDRCELMVALTCSGCVEGINYEREELLGDSYLKYAVSRWLAVGVVRGEVEGGRVQELLHDRISNSTLYHLALHRSIPSYVHAQPMGAATWLKRISRQSPPPPGTPPGMPGGEGGQTMSRKMVADVIEALIGVYVSSASDERGALRLMTWLGMELVPRIPPPPLVS